MHRCPLPVKLVALEELELDLRNYRLPIRVTDERQAVLYMLENEKILELAEEIVKYGYLDNEFPLVVADVSRFKVVEGNRRVTAERVKLFVCGGVTCTCRSGLGRRPPFG